MPPVVAAAGAVYAGITAAGAAIGAAVGGGTIGALASAAFYGAVVGAAVGAATAAITGENILKGALKGAAVGFVSGGVLKGVGMAMSPAAGTTAGVGEAGLTATTEAGKTIPATGTAGLETAAAPATAPVPPVNAAAPAAGAATEKAAEQGLLGGASKFLSKNAGEIIGRTGAGAAESMLGARQKEKDLEALMERDELNRDALKIKGLENLTLKSPLPSISGFMERPKWQIPQGGLIWGGLQNAEPEAAATAKA